MEKYSDFTNVETQRSFLVPEELPEGPYGSPSNATEAVKGKETPWQEGQRFYSNFAYENRSLHANLPRQIAGSHPTHSDGEDEEPDYH